MKQAAGFILYNDKKQILLQHRTDDAPTDASKWSVFGGVIEEGEDPKETAIRECKEELCYILKDPQMILQKQYGPYMTYTFCEKYDGIQKLELHEGQGMGWFTFEEARKLDLAEYHEEIFDDIESLVFD